MNTMLSQTAEYALMSVLYLADHGHGRPVRVGVMARALGVPQNYLSKTCHALVRSGVLASMRGPAGGFRLAGDPAQVTLLSVVAPFDRIGGRRQCLLGRPTCSDRRACPVHESWKRAADQVARFFRTTTIADIALTAASAKSSSRRPG